MPIALTAGSRCQTRTLNTSTKMMPTTNSGNEASASMTLDVTLSNAVSRLRALYPPNHSDSGIEITDAEHEQEQRVDDAVADVVEDRLPGVERVARVAGDHALQPVGVLVERRVVEAELARAARDAGRSWRRGRGSPVRDRSAATGWR